MEAFLRRGMLGIAVVMALGTAGELILAGHTGSLVQGVPFVCLGLAGITAMVVWIAPSPQTVRVVWGVVALLLVGAVFGVWEHLEHNHEFESEIRPEANAGTLLWLALFGASPLLAPGVLGVLGLLMGCAVWRHPALASPLDEAT